MVRTVFLWPNLGAAHGLLFQKTIYLNSSQKLTLIELKSIKSEPYENLVLDDKKLSKPLKVIILKYKE
jgi:hypothetical protein